MTPRTPVRPAPRGLGVGDAHRPPGRRGRPRVGGFTELTFLVEFDRGAAAVALRTTPVPVVGSLAVEVGHVSQGRRQTSGTRAVETRLAGLVLVHGLTGQQARRAPRLDREPARPRQVRGGRPGTPGPQGAAPSADDAAVVRDALDRLAADPIVRHGPVAVIAVSVGLGPVALALGSRRWLTASASWWRSAAADARELVRYFTTSAYASTGHPDGPPWIRLADLPRPEPRPRARRAGPGGRRRGARGPRCPTRRGLTLGRCSPCSRT
jgi:hypothetical protein